MEIVKPSARRQPLSTRGKSTTDKLLQMYDRFPIENISIENLQKIAFDRIKALQVLEDVKENYRGKDNGFRSQVKDRFMNLTLGKLYNRASADVHDGNRLEIKKLVQDDVISHFILRLAFCRTPELRSWFINLETELFKYRLWHESETSQHAVSAFLANYDFPISETTVEDLQMSKELPDWFKECIGPTTDTHASNKQSTVFKVQFTFATDIVKNRKALLFDGVVYFTKSELPGLISTFFRTHLSQQIATFSRYFDRIQGDKRVLKLLGQLSRMSGGPATQFTKAPPGEISVDNIDTLCAKSFPPCMRQMHEHLRKEHHLKHTGRMQFGLFLKGIGLSLDDSMRLWRTEFTKKMDLDKFEKHHAYTIRHNYGKEGKRTDYTPYGCSKIIGSVSGGPDDVSGCPFKGCDVALLEKKLKSWGVHIAVAEKVIEKARVGNCQSACTRFFEGMHAVTEGNVDTINHPNQYFSMSREIIKWKESQQESQTQPMQTDSQAS